MFEQKFRKVEKVLRPRKAIKHSEAIDILATVVKEADEEIELLEEVVKEVDVRIELLEEENVFYRNWLIISTLVIAVQGVALLLG